MGGSPTTMSPLLLRNLLTSLFIYADKFIVNLGKKYKLLQLLRYLLVSSFLFFLRILPSLNPSEDNYTYSFKPSNSVTSVPAFSGGGFGDSGIARALSQLLSIINEIPVSSRKYEIVRSLAEMIMDENLREGNGALREVNCAVLSAAFSRTLGQLEARVAAMDQEHGGVGAGDVTEVQRSRNYYGLNRVWRAVRYCGDVVWAGVGKSRDESGRTGSSAERLTAELLWLAQKLAACGSAEEAVRRWASATKLAWLSLSAEPRLQDSLVKVSAFLLKQVKEMRGEDESKREQERRTKMKILMLWLPLLCRASNGADAPVLSINEKAELEGVLGEIIEALEQEEEQEQVLSLWLHHFTHCLSSDWPNLHSCYARWCTASRRLLLLH